MGADRHPLGRTSRSAPWGGPGRWGGASFGLWLPGSESQEADGIAQRCLTHCKGGRTEQAKSDITVQAKRVGSGDPAVHPSRHLKGSESIISTSVQKDIQNKPQGLRQGMGGGGKRVKRIRCHHPEQRVTVSGMGDRSVWAPRR